MYYQTLFNGALAGVNSSGLMPGIIKIASVILIISLLYSVYTAYTAGGDVRILGTAAIKYLILGLVLVNYAAAFGDVNNMFNGVANYIVHTGPGIRDVFESWGQQIALYWHNSHGVLGVLSFIYHLAGNAAAGFTGAILVVVAFLLYRIAYLLFALFYTVYGAILYVCGPFVLALMPATGIGQISRTYLINLMIFNAWGLIYAILSELIYALHMSDVNTVLSNGSYLNLTVTNPMVILGVASLLYAIMIALIPYIASRIVRGDVGGTLLTVAGAALTAATVAASAAGAALMGTGGGWSYGSQIAGGGGSHGGGGGGGGQGGGISEGAGGRSVDASQSSSSTPPPPPASSSGNGGGRRGIPPPWQPGYNMPGHRPAFNFTHAASWYGGYAARAVYNRMKGSSGDEQS
ncbi:MAG TPA: hypothetical protein VFZ08_03495 [Terriglobia bacterium]|nr:hypothetical protein [Terriglobia bacterium]